MWISLFTIVLAIALGFGLGAVVLESYEEEVAITARPAASQAYAYA